MRNLKIGDTIGLVAPSGPLNKETIKGTIALLKKLGFKIKEGKHIYEHYGYLAGKDIDRAKDLMEMFEDNEVSLILCVRGGYGAMRILPYLDFNIIKNNPKLFAGFSDITVLLNVFYQKCNLTTFHSPMCNSCFDEITLDSFLNTLMNQAPSITIKNPEGIDAYSNSKAIIQSEIVGGNLSLICSTLGTEYEIDTKNKILFIEEVGEEPYKIDRMLTQLVLAEKISKCSGIILGQFSNCEFSNYDKSLRLNEVIEDRIISTRIPLLLNFMVGHCQPNLTIPIGTSAKVNFKEKEITIYNPLILD